MAFTHADTAWPPGLPARLSDRRAAHDIDNLFGNQTNTVNAPNIILRHRHSDKWRRGGPKNGRNSPHPGQAEVTAIRTEAHCPSGSTTSCQCGGLVLLALTQVFSAVTLRVPARVLCPLSPARHDLAGQQRSALQNILGGTGSPLGGNLQQHPPTDPNEKWYGTVDQG